jgi:hypothetical protein
MFNRLSGENLAHLDAAAIPPAAALDPHVQQSLSPDAIAMVQQVISSGLIWVFGAMLAVVLIQTMMTLLMAPKKKPDHNVGTVEAFDASCA